MVEKLKQDFKFLQKEKGVLAILLYGSQIKKPTPRSDIDICIVAPKANKSNLLMKVYRQVNVVGKKYDVRIFENLGLRMKIEIIRNHEIIWARDPYELSEYFYFYRKLWNNQKHRNELTKEELISLLE